MSEKTREARVWRLAIRKGYRISKSRSSLHLNNRGQFMLLNDRNTVVLGSEFDASLERIQEYLSADRTPGAV